MTHPAENGVIRVPPDCWPVCEYGAQCPHEWRVIPPGGTEA